MANNTLIEGLDNNQKTGLLQRDHPGRRRARNRQRLDQQLRRGVRPLGRRDHQRHAQVRHERLQRQRLLLRQHRVDQRQRLLHAPEGADEVRAAAASRSAGRSSRNKFFFFGDYQRTIDNLGYVVRATIPTLAMRNGDFSAVASGIYDPLTGDVERQRTARRSRTTRFRRTASARSRGSCWRSFRSRTSPARRSARTTSSRRRSARRRPTGSTRR